MNLHSQMMNVTHRGGSKDYREGHRDARHVCAEIAAKADQEIAGLTALLTNVDYVRLREKYDRGQLSFYGRITELERAYVGRVLTA